MKDDASERYENEERRFFLMFDRFISLSSRRNVFNVSHLLRMRFPFRCRKIYNIYFNARFYLIINFIYHKSFFILNFRLEYNIFHQQIRIMFLLYYYLSKNIPSV